jgi:hypothetical protein
MLDLGPSPFPAAHLRGTLLRWRHSEPTPAGNGAQGLAPLAAVRGAYPSLVAVLSWGSPSYHGACSGLASSGDGMGCGCGGGSDPVDLVDSLSILSSSQIR